MKKLWSAKWFILASVLALFFMATGTKVAFAGTDTQLQIILGQALAGLNAYFNFLIDILQKVW